jgi:hypothetical protein
MTNKLSLALLLAASATACVSEETEVAEPASETITSNLDKENGGYTTTDEASVFGEAALFRDAALESTGNLADALANDPAVREMQSRPEMAMRGVVMMWGKLPADPDATTATEWNGTITASRGALIVARKIAFEDRTDAVLPRENRAVVAFTSKTSTHSDGLVLRVIDPTPTAAEPLTLTYQRQGGASYTISLATLAQGPQVIEVEGDNKIAIASVRHREGCDAGAMRGRWRKVAPNLGHFLGLVVDKDGQEIGHVRGIFGERNGERRLFGKFINNDGAFRGIMVGTYNDEGRFTARWLHRSGDAGRISGVFRPGRDGAERHGGFLARWAETTCSDDRAGGT